MMPKSLVTFFSLVPFISFGICAERYKDSSFEIEKTSNLIYASDVPFLKKKHFVTSLAIGLRQPSDEVPSLYFYQNANEITYENLHFDLYQPKSDTTNNRPLVIVVHGGAFVSGSKDDQTQPIVGYCDSLAARGYVVASIDYRIGLILKDVKNQLIIDSLDFKRAIQWGVLDLQRAVHHFKTHAQKYKINPNRIFVIGNSSGAILALHSAMEKDGRVRGTVSLWGATIDSSCTKKITAPILLIHGTNDKIIPFTKGKMLNLDSAKRQNRFMLGYASAASAFNINFSSPTFYGGYVIDSILTQNRIVHETYFVDGLGHDFYDREPYKTNVIKRIVEFLYKYIQFR